MENVTVRMSEAERDLVERLAAERGVSRSDAIRSAVRAGAREELLRVALERYREGAVGLRGAADVAGVGLAEVMAEASERGVPSALDASDVADDVETLR